VYSGLQQLSTRSFKKASELLLDALPTFTATELIDYDEFVTLCVLAGVFALDRKDLKKKIIESPEVISVLPNVPTLKGFTESLYKTDYSTFFRSLATVEEQHFLPSLLLSPHARYYTRELRLKAYSQLLESYRSVTLSSLSTAFGVSEEWLDT
jgi:26S proteasome regulatory subunit N7